VLSEDGVEAQGSGRSIKPFHLLEGLESMPDLFVRFGGHRQAAGVTLAVDRIAEFRERLNRYAAERLSPEDLEPTLDIDGVVRFSDLTDEAAAEVLNLAPFGFGNQPPVFAAKAAEVYGPPEVFKECHLRVRLRQNGRCFRLTAWQFAERASEFDAGSMLDAAVALEDDPYSASRGYSPWRLVLKDVRRTASAGASEPAA
jgi:single-stranded-DNA-specific exonuclease